jgi:2''-5'' RNA ligase
MKRIFVAVDISEEARRKAAVYVENLRRRFSDLRVGWEKPEKLHLTLKFLGDIDDKKLEKLTVAVSRTAEISRKFSLRITGTGVFPNPRRARVVWLGVEDHAKSLSKLWETLESECEREGFERESRAFSPHLTIGRLREPERSGELVTAHLGENFESEEFEVSEIVIYQSRLLPQGSRYTVVSRHKIAEKR